MANTGSSSKSAEVALHYCIASFDGINFIDSDIFIQKPLFFFSKTFGRTELKKGQFPHLF